MTPEPCLFKPISAYGPRPGHCQSPVACAGFGYCRERNFKSGVPDAETQQAWRKLAAERKKG